MCFLWRVINTCTCHTLQSRRMCGVRGLQAGRRPAPGIYHILALFAPRLQSAIIETGKEDVDARANPASVLRAPPFFKVKYPRHPRHAQPLPNYT